MKRLIFCVVAMLLTTTLRAGDFESYFNARTLRLDYVMAGNAEHQIVALDELSTIEGWWGRRNNLDSVPHRGNGEVRVVEKESGKVLYRNSFSTLFQEWLSIPEAKQISRSFEATLLVPEPKKEADIEVVLYDIKGCVTASLKHTYSPDDVLIRKLVAEKPTPHKYLHRGGNSEECIDVAIIAEGYRIDEMTRFEADAQKACSALLSYEPFATYADRFNIVAVFSPSLDSDVSVPQDNIWRKTAVNSNFMTFYTERYLTTNSLHQTHDLLTGIPYEHLIILANTATYGGGGIYNFYTLTTTHHEAFKPVVVHEFGHSFGGLGDEYFYDDPAATGYAGDMYSLDYEPWEPNITSLVDFGSKWQNMLPEGIAIPTKPTKERRESYAIGVYEGGGYLTKGMYRPAVTCRMRDNVATQFCPVCQAALERVIKHQTF